MEKSEEMMEKLKAKVKSAPEYFKKSDKRALEYANHVVVPALQDVLKALCLQIEEHHKVEDNENSRIFVIHYTSIATLVSILQGASAKQQERKGKESVDKEFASEPKPSDKKTLWRLYDSVHLNDPDEGNYFARNLNLPQKYDWLEKIDVRHAYIASFILPNNKKDMSNNLVFWRTYGQEGEGCSLSLSVPCSELRQILYGPDKVKSNAKVLRPVLDSLKPLVRIRDSSLRESIREKLAETIWKSLERIRYLYKSKAYEYEHECRLIVPESDTDKNKIRFEYQDRNNSPARLRHYYEHEDLHIKDLMRSGSSITLGPCVPYRDNVRSCIEVLKDRAELYGPKIKFSDIPYRRT